MPYSSKTLKIAKAPGTWTTLSRKQIIRSRQKGLATCEYSEIVKKPQDASLNDWISFNLTEFFEQIILLYGSVSEKCAEKCRHMDAGPKYKYLWRDEKGVPQDLKAVDYCMNLFEWVDNQLPYITPVDGKYHKNFTSVVQDVFRRLFRVYAHIYHSHWSDVIAQKAEEHVNSATRHFTTFIKAYKLMDIREMEPLRELMDSWKD